MQARGRGESSGPVSSASGSSPLAVPLGAPRPPDFGSSSLSASHFRAMIAPNNSFTPNPLRSTNNMAGKACHVVGSTTQVGLTQALALMKNKPPLLLTLAAATYLAYLAFLLATDFKVVVAGRFIFSAVLLFFVLRGSRIAGNILAILCAISALILLVAAVATFKTNAQGAVIFTVVAGLLLAFSAYLLFGPSIRAFQNRVRAVTVP